MLSYETQRLSMSNFQKCAFLLVLISILNFLANKHDLNFKVQGISRKR